MSVEHVKQEREVEVKKEQEATAAAH